VCVTYPSPQSAAQYRSLFSPPANPPFQHKYI
jgi:hypothetical protein